VFPGCSTNYNIISPLITLLSFIYNKNVHSNYNICVNNLFHKYIYIYIVENIWEKKKFFNGKLTQKYNTSNYIKISNETIDIHKIKNKNYYLFYIQRLLECNITLIMNRKLFFYYHVLLTLLCFTSIFLKNILHLTIQILTNK
jgi:hypothetical protein